MEYTTLGSTGATVSQLCFGTWRFGGEVDRETAHDLLDRCADHGINFIDTANVYGPAEEYIGEWLADRDREEYVIASKVYGARESRFDENLSRKAVRAEIEGTLDRLGTDYVDLYYIHAWDPGTPIRETLGAMTDLVREGRVHYLGASNTAGWQLVKSLWESDRLGLERFEATQPRFSANYREPVGEGLAACADQDIAVCPFSPLGGGFLTGKYGPEGAPEGARYDDTDQFSESDWAVLEAVESVAEAAGATPAQVALRWLIDQREFTCIPIFGARTADQFEENVGAADLSLSAAQFDRITEAGED